MLDNTNKVDELAQGVLYILTSLNMYLTNRETRLNLREIEHWMACTFMPIFRL